jgi:ribose 1,5-bisphosphokinase
MTGLDRNQGANAGEYAEYNDELSDTCTRIGPGHLVLLVGPSGAGKDTLIAHVRAATREDERVSIPRRVITRASDDAEDHDTLTDVAFDQAIVEGAFAVWWSAHGHRYGIPVTAEDAIRAGRTVVCNVSRSVVRSLRERFSTVTVVLITAPVDILETRLAARGRVSDGDLAKRIARSQTIDAEAAADVVIANVGTVQVAAAQLLEVVRK